MRIMRAAKILKLSRKKVAILIILILAVMLGFNFFGKKKPVLLQFTQVKKQNIRSSVSASGTLTGKNSAGLRFKSSGKLAYTNVKTGDKVYAGQVIAGLDTQELSIALQQARNTLTDKQATVDKIHDDVKGHDADESFTQRQLRTTAEVAANNAYDAVKQAERAFQDAVILSPVDGIVTQAIQISGQTVGSSDIIARIVDTSAIYFDTDADEADISKISMGLPAEVTLDSYPDKRFKGTVDQIVPQIKTTSQGATVVTIRIKLDQTDIFFVDGLTGQASIITEEAKNVLAIPQEALREDSTVIVSNDQGLRSQKVAPGIRSETDVEIKEGLRENDKVLLNPPAPGSNLTSGRGGNPLGGIFRFLGGGRGR